MTGVQTCALPISVVTEIAIGRVLATESVITLGAELVVKTVAAVAETVNALFIFIAKLFVEAVI